MKLTKPEVLLLDAVFAFLHDEKVNWGGEQKDSESRSAFLNYASAHSENPPDESFFASVTPEDFTTLVRLAASHKILPLMYNVIYACPAYTKLLKDPEYGPTMKKFSQGAIREIMLQTLKTDEFRKLYLYLEEKGLHPMVVKGLVLRNLYKNGDQRPSADEDLLIPEDEWEEAVRVMKDYEMVPLCDGNPDGYEIGWRKGPLYIELHRSLFPPESEYGKEFLRYFQDAADRTVRVRIKTDGVDSSHEDQGFSVRTFCPEDHLLFLLAHTWKHFVHSGFGLRQVIDAGLFAAFYGEEIDWKELKRKCTELEIERFAEALFSISEKALGIETPWIKGEPPVEEYPMLKDLLTGGLYGSSTRSRLHSSTVTLNKAEASRRNKKATFLNSAFPPLKKMQASYPELKKYPVLLPFVWVKRIVRYRKETKSQNANSTSETLRIAAERTKLLKFYGVIK